MRHLHIGQVLRKRNIRTTYLRHLTRYIYNLEVTPKLLHKTNGDLSSTLSILVYTINSVLLNRSAYSFSRSKDGSF